MISLAHEWYGKTGIVTGFGRPFGLMTESGSGIYVVDMDLHGIFQITEDFTYYRAMFDENGWSDFQALTVGMLPAADRRRPGRFNGPHSIDRASDGIYCVTCYYDPSLHFFLKDGIAERVQRTVSPGEYLAGPATAVFDAKGDLLVAEYAKNLIYVLGQDGELLVSYDGLGKSNEHFIHINRPHMARRFSNGNILVADTWNHRLLLLNADGEPLNYWGYSESDDRTAWKDPETRSVASNKPAGLHGPVSIDICPQTEKVLVSDWGNHRIRLISPEGPLLECLFPESLNHPYDARFWRNGIVVADSHNSRLVFQIS